MHIDGCAVYKAEGDKGVFSGLASVYNVLDRGGDIVMPGAFSDAKAENVYMLLQHNIEMPIGVFTEFKDTEKALNVAGQLAIDTQKGSDVHKLMLMGALREMSVGFRYRPDIKGSVTYEEDGDGGEIRRIHKAKLIEISIVVGPIMPKARITSVKALLDATEKKSLEQLFHAGGFSNRDAKKIVSMLNDMDPDAEVFRDEGSKRGDQNGSDAKAVREMRISMSAMLNNTQTRSALAELKAMLGAL
jgi:HK97 family phage prohead protease